MLGGSLFLSKISRKVRGGFLLRGGGFILKSLVRSISKLFYKRNQRSLSFEWLIYFNDNSITQDNWAKTQDHPSDSMARKLLLHWERHNVLSNFESTTYLLVLFCERKSCSSKSHLKYAFTGLKRSNVNCFSIMIGQLKETVGKSLIVHSLFDWKHLWFTQGLMLALNADPFCSENEISFGFIRFKQTLLQLNQNKSSLRQRRSRFCRKPLTNRS